MCCYFLKIDYFLYLKKKEPVSDNWDWEHQILSKIRAWKDENGNNSYMAILVYPFFHILKKSTLIFSHFFCVSYYP